jgi:hypothetical protein
MLHVCMYSLHGFHVFASHVVTVLIPRNIHRKVTDCAPVAGTTDVEDDEQYLVDILSQFLADQRYAYPYIYVLNAITGHK